MLTESKKSYRGNRTIKLKSVLNSVFHTPSYLTCLFVWCALAPCLFVWCALVRLRALRALLAHLIYAPYLRALFALHKIFLRQIYNPSKIFNFPGTIKYIIHHAVFMRVEKQPWNFLRWTHFHFLSIYKTWHHCYRNTYIKYIEILMFA